jgi:hypothetical protein
MTGRLNILFTWVWRINGLLILGIGLVGFVGVVAFVVDVGIFSSRESPAEGIAEVAGTQIENSNLNFGTFRRLKGANVLYAELGTASDYLGSGSISQVANVRNLLFFDTESKKSHWLLKDNSKQIYRNQCLTDPPDCYDVDEDRERCEANRKTVAIMLEIGPPRSEKPSSDQDHSILVSTPDGRELAPLVENIDAVLGVEAQSAEAVFIFYTKSGSVRFAEIDPTKRKLVSDEAL